GLLPEQKRRRRRSRARDHVDVAERAREIVADQLAYALCLEVVRIVVACRQHVCAGQDPPLNLGTEALSAVALVKARKIELLGLRRAVPVADAVEPREVRR